MEAKTLFLGLNCHKITVDRRSFIDQWKCKRSSCVMSVSDLHSKFTFNRAHWLCILQQDHHHHVRSSFFSWWSIKLHQTNSRQKSFMRFLYSLFLGLLEFEREWCLLLLFFSSFCVLLSATNLFISYKQPDEWLCATRFDDDVIFLSFRYGGLHDIVRFL